MSYGVSITVKYTETTSTGTITKETIYKWVKKLNLDQKPENN